MKINEKWEEMKKTPLSKKGEIIYWVLMTNSISITLFAPIKNIGLKFSLITFIILRHLKDKKNKPIWIILLFLFLFFISSAILYYIPIEEYRQNLR